MALRLTGILLQGGIPSTFSHIISVMCGNKMIFVFYLAYEIKLENKQQLSFKNFNCLPSSSNTNSSSKEDVDYDELEKALMGASKGNNKTMIIAMVNKAYVEGENKTMLDLFLESFWLGEGTYYLLDRLLLVAVDPIAMDRCKFLRLHCYELVVEGVDFGAEQFFMSKGFLKLMWSRTRFLADVLKRGYNFIFTCESHPRYIACTSKRDVRFDNGVLMYVVIDDTDVMWLRDPFPMITSPNRTNVDIQFSCDWFNGNPWKESKAINTGFYFVRSNNKTVSLFETWHAMKDNSNYTKMKEQDVLVSLLGNGLFTQLGLKTRFLETQYFSGFCQDSKDFSSVITVHANCCVSIRAKAIDLVVVLRDWKNFKTTINVGIKDGVAKNSSINEGTVQNICWSKHAACRQ
ncbi:hypothetical protein Syun_018696 [Stephania yunnanensis]|uniref:Nucleotide-diphospho-sugar transferase domain-containing protein n=1 Tax=Stephania yunnanensis TaxID=152371 RepID=A0AAP0ISR3_9MAGN